MASTHDTGGNATFTILLMTISFFLLTSGAVAAQDADMKSTLRVLLLPKLETTLAAEIAGRIETMNADIGERFAAGKDLIVFDCRLSRAELDIVKADLEERRKTLEVNQKLNTLKSVSTLDMATSEARLQRSEADVTLRRTQVEKCRVKAPFGGRVTKRHANLHQYVTAGQPLLDIIDDTHLIAQVFVPSQWLSWLKTGARFELLIEETGKSYAAKVTVMGAKVDPVSQTIEVRGGIEGNHPELLAGMSGSALFGQQR